jgi:hypothetical protein
MRGHGAKAAVEGVISRSVGRRAVQSLVINRAHQRRHRTRAGDPTDQGGVGPSDSSLEREVLSEPDARADDNCVRIVRPVLEWHSDHVARARPAYQVLEVVQIGLGAAIPSRRLCTGQWRWALRWGPASQ